MAKTSEPVTTAPAVDSSPPVVRHLGLALLALMLGVFLAALNAAILATALPTVVAELDGAAHMAWVVTIYLLLQTVSTPLWGKAGDLIGRKSVFATAIILFVVGSLLAGTTQSFEGLIIFRAIQGLGAGGLMVNAQALIVDLVEPAKRGRYLAVFGSLFAVTSVAGPLLGGLFVEVLDWRWIFYLNVPIAALALTLVLLFLPKRTAKRAIRIDYLGSVIMVVSVAAIVLVTSFGGSEFDWISLPSISLMVIAVAGTIAFLFVERRAVEPVIPLGLFRARQFRGAVIMAFGAGIGMLGIGTFIPTYFQYVVGLSPVNSGLIQLPQVAAMLLGSFLSNRLLLIFRYQRTSALLGVAVMTVGLVSFVFLDRTTPLWVSGVCLGVYGLGLGVIMQLGLVLAQRSADLGNVGSATAVSTFFRTMGMSIGTATLGAVYSGVLIGQFVADGHVDTVSTLTPGQLWRLDEPLHSTVLTGYETTLHAVFLTSLIVGVIALIGALTLGRTRSDRF